MMRMAGSTPLGHTMAKQILVKFIWMASLIGKAINVLQTAAAVWSLEEEMVEEMAMLA